MLSRLDKEVGKDNLQYLFFYGGIADGKNGTDYYEN